MHVYVCFRASTKQMAFSRLNIYFTSVDIQVELKRLASQLKNDQRTWMHIGFIKFKRPESCIVWPPTAIAVPIKSLLVPFQFSRPVNQPPAFPPGCACLKLLLNYPPSEGPIVGSQREQSSTQIMRSSDAIADKKLLRCLSFSQLLLNKYK